LFMAARNVVASQQQEVTNDSSLRAVNTVRKEDENGDVRMNIDHEKAAEQQQREEEMEKIDEDASFSQQAAIEQPPPPTPAPAPMPTPDVSDVNNHINQDGETAYEERTLDAVAHAQPDVLPHIQSDPMSDQKFSYVAKVKEEEAEANAAGNVSRLDENHFRLHPAVSESELDNNGNKIQRRHCLKRKHDSLENSVSSPKVACIVHHRVTESSVTSSVVQQNTPPPSPTLNGLLSALKTATLNKSSENADNENNASTVSPLSRSLSCSNFMELTCES